MSKTQASKPHAAPAQGNEKLDALKAMVLCAGWQKVLKPALEDMIAATQNQWMNNIRVKGEEHLSDDALKERAKALNWVLAWESKYKDLFNSFEQIRALREKTEPPTDGGSPY